MAAKIYDMTNYGRALQAMEDRITDGSEFRLRQIWTLGNRVAGWYEFDDKTPAYKEAWRLVNSYRVRNMLSHFKRGGSKIWRYVGV